MISNLANLSIQFQRPELVGTTIFDAIQSFNISSGLVLLPLLSSLSKSDTSVGSNHLCYTLFLSTRFWTE